MEKNIVIKNADFSVNKVIPENGSIVDISNEFIFNAPLPASLLYTDGTYEYSAGTSRANANFVNCRGAKFIEISMPVYTTTPVYHHLVFYNDTKVEYDQGGLQEVKACPVKIIPRPVGATKGRQIIKVEVPTNAKYVRTTWLGAADEEAFGPFVCKLYY